MKTNQTKVSNSTSKSRISQKKPLKESSGFVISASYIINYLLGLFVVISVLTSGYGCQQFTSISSDNTVKIDSTLKDIRDIINGKGLQDSVLTIRYNDYAIVESYTTPVPSGISFNMQNYAYNKNLIAGNYREKPIPFLSNDTVYVTHPDLNWVKYSGQIRVLGDLRIINDDHQEVVLKNKTIALFNVKDGCFDGEQLYLVEDPAFSPGDSRNEYKRLFIKTRIYPMMSMIQNLDFIEVYDEIGSDYSFNGRYFKYLKKTRFEFPVTFYWTSGFEFYTLPMIYDYWNYTQFNPYLVPVANSELTINHYNGNPCFRGYINGSNELIKGQYFSYNNLASDKLHVRLQVNPRTEISLDDHRFKIEDYVIKQFRKYFGIYDLNKAHIN
jgi:hypothetical protein